MYTSSTYTPENNSYGTVSQDFSRYRTWRTQAWNNTVKTEYQKLAYHIKVGQTGTCCPKNGASFHRLHLKSIKLKNNSTLTHHPLISLGTGAIKVWWGALRKYQPQVGDGWALNWKNRWTKQWSTKLEWASKLKNDDQGSDPSKVVIHKDQGSNCK